MVPEDPHTAGGQDAAIGLALASLFAYFLEESCCSKTHDAQDLHMALYLEVFTQSSAFNVHDG